jgi:hypothetical protein
MFYTKSNVSGSPKCQTRLILQASGAVWGEGCGYSIRTAWPPAPHSLMKKVLISKALGVGSLPRYEGGSSRGNKYLVEGQYFRPSAPQLSAVHASRLLGFRQFSLTPHADTDPGREKVLFSSKWISTTSVSIQPHLLCAAVLEKQERGRVWGRRNLSVTRSCRREPVSR